MTDWTDFVESLRRCPDGHFWTHDPDDVRTCVENLGDDAAPLYVWRAFVRCPRCAFESPVEQRDATPAEIEAARGGGAGSSESRVAELRDDRKTTKG